MDTHYDEIGVDLGGDPQDLDVRFDVRDARLSPASILPRVRHQRFEPILGAFLDGAMVFGQGSGLFGWQFLPSWRWRFVPWPLDDM